MNLLRATQSADHNESQAMTTLMEHQDADLPRTASQAFEGIKAVQENPFTPSIDLWSQAHKIEGVKDYQGTREFAESHDVFMPVFRIQVPVNHIGKVVGPSGLNLRKEFGMHVVAIEKGEHVHLNIGADTVLNEGDCLWFGLGGTMRTDPTMIPREIPNEAINGLRCFIGSRDLSSVEFGHMPVIKTTVPDKWIAQSLLELDLRGKYGINLCAVVTGTIRCDVVWFPPPSHTFEEGDEIFMMWGSFKNFLRQRRAFAN